MKLHFTDSLTRGEFYLTIQEKVFDRFFFKHGHKDEFLTIAWNNGPKQIVSVDEVEYDFPQQCILPLMVNQSFRFEKPEQLISWQYNRDFYCIVDHDKEVSCVGFLFYGSAGIMMINLDDYGLRKIEQLLPVFIDEFQTADVIQKDMLQILLKRLIIIVTRLAKKQYINNFELTDNNIDVIRQFNLMLENHYRQQHQVQFYANQLHKSPKTLANLFGLYNHHSPLAVIQERVILEAKRLLIYTNKPVKEIASYLGFEDTAYFSNFFKRHISCSPMEFRNTKSSFLSGH
jgi:AraC family transcriptional regulator, transcriptional activator of pobA